MVNEKHVAFEESVQDAGQIEGTLNMFSLARCLGGWSDKGKRETWFILSKCLTGCFGEGDEHSFESGDCNVFPLYILADSH